MAEQVPKILSSEITDKYIIDRNSFLLKKIIDIEKIDNNIKEKYSITENTFVQVVKNNPADFLENEIGDIKQPLDFYPQVKIKRWDNEVNFSLRLVNDEKSPSIETTENVIQWKGDKIEAHFYDKPEISEDGAYEFEIILKEKPKSNIIQFSIQTKGLKFYYQPELTQQEKDEGAEKAGKCCRKLCGISRKQSWRLFKNGWAELPSWQSFSYLQAENN